MMRAVFGQVRADFLEKSRKFSFLAMVAMCLIGVFGFVPRPGNGFEIMSLQSDTFIQGGNPSWIPVTSALGLAFFMPFFGFFYLRNSVAYDEKVGVWQLVTASGVGKLAYLFGKFLSGTLILYLFVLTVVVGSFFMTLWHFPGEFLSTYAFWSPYLFLLASAPMCAAVAVFFGSVRFLRGAVGSVIFCFAAIMLIVAGMEMGNRAAFRAFDVTAMSSLMGIVSNTAYQQTGHEITSLLLIGGTGPGHQMESHIHMVFNGLQYHTADMAVFGLMLLVALGFVVAAAPLYAITGIKLPTLITTKTKRDNAPARTSHAAYFAANPSNRRMWLAGVCAEIKLMLKGFPAMWYVVACVGVVLSAFLGISPVQSYVLPITMLWFINVFSQLGSREHKMDMLQIIGTIPGGRLAQVIYSWIAGAVIALVVASPVIIRLAVSGQLVGVFAVVAGVVFLPSAALFLGEYTKSSRVFEVLFIIVTYVAMNGLPIAMYMGYAYAPNAVQGAVYLVVGVVLAVFAVLRRGALYTLTT